MNLKMNKIIKALIFSDVALSSGFGFVAPIFAIFLTSQIKGGNVEFVGYVAAIYWIIVSLTVVPFGHYLDKNHGEKDDFYFIVIGNLLAAGAVFGYMISSLTWHIYAFHIFYALGMSMNIAAYGAVFTRHIDENREAFDWSVRASLIGIGTGIAGALGGIIANRFGFNVLFMGVLILVLISALLPFLIYKQICPKDKKVPHIPTIK